MSQDQPFIWKSSLGGPISWVGQSSWGSPRQVKEFSQVDGVSDMAPACQLFVGRDARYFSLSLYTTGTLQAATTVLELRGSESE